MGAKKELKKLTKRVEALEAHVGIKPPEDVHEPAAMGDPNKQ